MALSKNLLSPGEMTQGLCSPWQADYRECGCYYWAASRPDYVNVETDSNGALTKSHDWMQKNRSNSDPYLADPRSGSAEHISYEDLYQNWETILKFIIGGVDAE